MIIPTVFIVCTITFFLMRFIPGNVIDAMISQNVVGGSSSVTVEGRKQMEHALGIDQPLLVQYGRFMGLVPQADGKFAGLLQGNLGKSLWQDRSINRIIASRWPVTLELGLLGLVLSQLFAIPIGLLSALRHDSWSDFIARSFAILMIGIPGFWLGTILIVFPSLWWGWSPPLTYTPLSENIAENLKMLLLPAIVMAMGISGGTMRMTRTMMLEVFRQDYIRTAWAKGLRERTVVVRHALKNALIPIVTVIGYNIPVLLGGTVVIETIFSLPGMGRLLVDAIQKRDYTIVSGVLLLFAFGMVLINLLIDIIYAYLDPRIRYR